MLGSCLQNIAAKSINMQLIGRVWDTVFRLFLIERQPALRNTIAFKCVVMVLELKHCVLSNELLCICKMPNEGGVDSE